MSERLARAATSATRTWVRCYTAGISTQERDERRAEMESDLWDQRDANRAAPGRFAVAILIRCLLGVPSDLAWRIERADGGALVWLIRQVVAAGERATAWVGTRGLPALPALLAGFYVLAGVLTLLTAANNDQGVAWALRSGAFLLAFGGLTWSGWKLGAQHARAGLAILAAGAVLPAAILAVTVVVPLATAIVFVLAIRRAHFFRRPVTQ